MPVVLAGVAKSVLLALGAKPCPYRWTKYSCPGTLETVKDLGFGYAMRFSTQIQCSFDPSHHLWVGRLDVVAKSKILPFQEKANRQRIEVDKERWKRRVKEFKERQRSK